MLSAVPRHQFYEPFVSHSPREVEASSGTLSAIWRSSSATTLVHRFLRFSFSQQGEAQRLYLRQQAEKHFSRSGPASRLPKAKLFNYKPVVSVLDEAKPSGRHSKTPTKPTSAAVPAEVPSVPPSPSPSPSPKKPTPEKLSRISSGEAEKEDEEDEDDILAVFNTIDKVDLEEASSAKAKSSPAKASPAKASPAKTKESLPAAAPAGSPVKEVFREPPASPNSVTKTKKSEQVPVVEHPVVVEKKATAPPKPERPPLPKPQQNFQHTLMSSVENLKTIMSNLKARISTQNGAGTEGKAANEDTSSKKSDADAQSVMKSSKDWYWFYMKKQTKEAEDGAGDDASKPSEPPPAKKSDPDPPTPKKSRLLPTPPKRPPLLQQDHKATGDRDSNSLAPPPLMQRNVTPYTPPAPSREPQPFPANAVQSSKFDYDHRRQQWAPSGFPDQQPYQRPPLLATRPSLLPQSSGRPYPGPDRPQRPPLLSHGPPGPTKAPLLQSPVPPRVPTCDVQASAAKDVDLRQLPVSSSNERSSFLTSKFDVDMRVPPAQYSRASVYDPQQRPTPERVEPSTVRPTKRISTYEPGRGFQ